MTKDQFYAMHEQMNWEIEPEEEPVDVETLSFEAQQALLLFNILPDKIEGMNGVWLGKEFSGLTDIMSIYEMINFKDTMDFLLIIINEYQKFNREEIKKQESQTRARTRKGR